jgi:hypothetical protein
VFVMWVGRRVRSISTVESMCGYGSSGRYPSDLTDAQWEIIEPMLPLPKWMGRPENHPRRAVIDAILYERDPGVSEHIIRWAAINGMLSGLTRGGPAIRQTRRTFDTLDSH